MRRLKIALTGTRGLLGGLLLERLGSEESCRKLVLLDLVPPKKRLKNTVFYRVDLTEATASGRMADALRREQPDVFVHLAFLQHPIRDPAYEHELESVGTMHVLAAVGDVARSGRALRLVASSSTMVYGARPDNPSFLGEDTALRGRPRYALVEDKVDAERQLERFRREAGVPVTVLRTAPLLGPGVRTLAGRYLSLPAVPTVMGFNPLVQLLHPDDAVEAFRLAILRAAATDQSAVYNVAGKSVLPLLTAIRLAARRSLPLPGFAAAPMVDALFQAGAAIAPAAHLDYLRWACVADRTRAADELGFVPRYSAKEAVSAFARGRWRAAA